MSARVESGFVTAVGWTFVVLGALLLCIALVQNLAFAMLSPLAADIAEWDGFPPSAKWVLLNLRTLLLANVGVGVATIAASIGLVRRREWARVLFVALMALGCAWHVAVVWLQFDFTSALQARLFPERSVDAGFTALLGVVRVASVGFAAAFCWLFGWIGLRLLRPEIRAEFA